MCPHDAAQHTLTAERMHMRLWPLLNRLDSGAGGCLHVSFIILVLFPYAPTMGHVKPEANSTVAR